MGKQNDIDVLISLFNIGDSGYILSLNTLLIKHNEMLIKDMRRAHVCRFLVIGSKLHQSTRNVLKTFLGFGIVS